MIAKVITGPDAGSPPPSGGSGDGANWGKVIAEILPVVIDWLGGIFSGSSNSRWTNAGPGVHAWFSSYGPQAFLDWMDANYPNGFQDMDTVRKLLVVWLAGKPWGGRSTMLFSDGWGIGYSGVDIGRNWWDPVVDTVYQQMGVDIQASKEEMLRAGRNDMALAVYTDGGIAQQAAQQAAADAVGAANSGTATPEQNNLVGTLLETGLAWMQNGTIHLGGGSTGGGSTGGGSTGGGSTGGGTRTPSVKTGSFPWPILLLGAGALYLANQKNTKKHGK